MRSSKAGGTGLRFRLVAFCLVIAAASTGFTAWASVLGTSSSLRQQYTQSAASIARVYDRLSDYAATHSTWTGVAGLVTALARQDQTQIILTSQTGALIADSGDDATAAVQGRPTVLVNALQPDSSVGDVPLVGGVDARAVGPFALSAVRQRTISKAVQVERTCVSRFTGEPAPAAEKLANGRSYLLPAVLAATTCAAIPAATQATEGERVAAAALTPALKRCFPNSRLTARGNLTFRMLTTQTTGGTVSYQVAGVNLQPASAGFLSTLSRVIGTVPATTQTCIAAARRTQLAPYVAPPARLYLSISTVLRQPGLSRAGRQRIAVTGAVILLATLLICYVAASRLRRPLSALTTAVTRVASGRREASVALRGTSEMRQLAVAVNDLAGQLDDADQRRQDLISDVAHELRTPLGNIRGWMEAIQDNVASPEPALIGRLLDEALLLQRLIDDLQDLALADAGELPVHPELVDAADIAAQVVAAGPTGPAQAVLVTSSQVGDTTLEADPVRLRQIVGNLLTNSRRATERGAITITVVGHPHEVVLAVTDSGAGIPAQDLPHLFDRFWRADRSRSRSRGGSGLGLAITHALVLAHQGRIDVRSEVGSGTTVTVALPRTASPVPAAHHIQPPGRGPR